MAAEEVRRFFAALETDSALTDKVQVAVTAAVDQLDALTSAARAEGYDFTYDELKTTVERMSHELTDDELEQVAGGFSGLTSTLSHGGLTFSPGFLGTMKDA